MHTSSRKANNISPVRSRLVSLAKAKRSWHQRVPVSTAFCLSDFVNMHGHRVPRESLTSVDSFDLSECVQHAGL